MLGLTLQVVALDGSGRRDLRDLALALRVEHIVVAQLARIGLVQLRDGHGLQQEAVGFQISLDMLLHLFGKLIAFGMDLEQIHLRGDGAQRGDQLFADQAFDVFRVNGVVA